MSATLSQAGKPESVVSMPLAINPIQAEHDAARARAREERAQIDATRAEKVRLAALAPLRPEELAAPAPIDAAHVAGQVAALHLLFDRMQRGVAPAGPTPADDDPCEADVVMVLGRDGKSDRVESMLATERKHHARLASRPRSTQLPRGPESLERMRIEQSFKIVHEAFAILSEALPVLHERMSRAVVEMRARAADYVAACDQARADFEAAQEASREAAARAERAELERVVQEEREREDKLRQAKALGIGVKGK